MSSPPPSPASSLLLTWESLQNPSSPSCGISKKWRGQTFSCTVRRRKTEMRQRLHHLTIETWPQIPNWPAYLRFWSRKKLRHQVFFLYRVLRFHFFCIKKSRNWNCMDPDPSWIRIRTWIWINLWIWIYLQHKIRTHFCWFCLKSYKFEVALFD